MNVSPDEIQNIHRKLDEINKRLRNVESWTRIPDNFDGASVHEKRDIGIVIRSEMRDALNDFFSPRRIVAGIVVTGGLVNVLIELWGLVARAFGGQ